MGNPAAEKATRDASASAATADGEQNRSGDGSKSDAQPLRLGVGRLSDCGIQSGRAFGIFPSDAGDVRTADSDVREFAITEAGQFLKAVPVCAPLAQEAEEVREQHGGIPLKVQKNHN
jgi:hypothetical protein